ncbi:MAG: CBS domain-containing protein [Candidatus Desulforudaceae bacterium]|jgi:tRNA nucleotidyltransferase (CCA-adding enzyme)|nr:CBS domain-containing protein [Eubacteriales bacterium]
MTVKVITTHTNTDFDGLAALVAAQKLYPDAELVLPGKLARNVEEFVALHRDVLELKKPNEVDLDQVSLLVVVDTRSPKRIGKVAEVLKNRRLQVHLYDHHPDAEGDLVGTQTVVEHVGAVTTLLVEEIKRRFITLTPFEATVLALGIYEDTGCMVYPSTTERDAESVAFLLAQGANLGVVADFLGRPLTDEQKTLLRSLLLSAERHVINGARILVAVSRTEEFIGGLALLTHKLAEIEQLDAVFCVVFMEDRIHIVSRSTLPEVNTRDILAVFGGGGHHAAASATVKSTELEEVTASLLSVIKEKVLPPLAAVDIMTSPVKSVRPETRIDEANRIMLRYGHTGLPVVGDSGLAGVISRRDVEKAHKHNLGHAPVKAFMSRHVHTVSASTPVTEVQALMIDKNIGRLLVVDNGDLLGIVSRTDVLRTLHPKFKPRFSTLYVQPRTTAIPYDENASEVLRRKVPEHIVDVLRTAGRVGSESGCTVYLAGEMVRDTALGVSNINLKLVVEGDGLYYPDHLAAALQGRRWDPGIENQSYVITPDGLRLLITSAESDFVEYGMLAADTINSPLRHALYRKDFTINALAVALNPDRFGEIIDYFGGREDLQYGLIRALHSLSFVENPLRIFHAVWMETQYQFTVEQQTLKLIREAVDDRLLRRLPKEQVFAELKVLLESPAAPKMLARLAQMNVWPQLFPTVTYWEVQPLLAGIPQAVDDIKKWDIPEPAEPWLCYLMAILYFTNLVMAEEYCTVHRLERRQINKIMNGIVKWKGTVSRLSANGDTDLKQVARYILGMPREAYPLVLLMLDEEDWKQRFYAVLQILQEHKPHITGKDIKSLGSQPGPYLPQAMNAVWMARLEGLPADREAELEVARKFIRDWEEG